MLGQKRISSGASFGGLMGRIAIASAALAVVHGTASAATYTFDGNTGSVGAQDGSGTWNASVSNLNWYDAGTSSNIAWPNTGNHTAAFGAGVDATAGTYVVTVGEAMNVGALSFLNSGYTLSAGSSVKLERSTGGGSISVAPGKTASIGANVLYEDGTGAGTVVIGGGGTLSLTGTIAATPTFCHIAVGGTGANATTTLDVKTGGLVYTNRSDNEEIRVGGTLRVSGGTVELRNTGTGANSSNLNVGFLATSNDYRAGTMELDSGTVAIYKNGDTSPANARSGSFRVGVRSTTGGTVSGTANLNGGILNVSNTPYPGGGGTGTSTNGGVVATASSSTGAVDGTINFNGTTVTVGPTSVIGLRFFGNDSQVSSTATMNLNAGVVTTPVVSSYSISGAGSSGTFNFNGGTLKANATNASYFGAANTNLLSVTANVKAGGAIIDTNTFDLGVGQALLHDATLGTTFDGGLTKKSAGTLTLSNANTYIGNTTVEAGTLALASTGSLLMDINVASNSKILGSGAANLDGRLRFDVSDIPALTEGAWQIVNVATLTETFGTNFSVALAGAPDSVFTENANVWTYVDGAKTWTFTESTGVLTAAVPEPASLGLLGIGAAMFLRRRRR